MHPHFEIVLGRSIPYFTVLNINDIPSDCKLIAWVFFDIYNQNLSDIIDSLLERTEYLIIEINEFVDESLVDLERQLHQHWPRLQITSTAIPNYPSRMLFSGAWCTTTSNPFHRTQLTSWAQRQLEELHPITDPRTRLFDCLLGTRRPHRDFIHHKVQSSNVQDYFVYSYFREHIDQGHWQDPAQLTVPSTGCKITMEDQTDVPSSVILPVNIYNQTYYSIVAETTTYNRFSFYTEKIVKPLVAQRLFVVFAGRGYLANLQRMGFKTFDSVIDESYDQIDCDYTRWEQAWRQVEKLCCLDPVEVAQIIQPVVCHNREVFTNTDWYQSVRDHIHTVLN